MRLTHAHVVIAASLLASWCSLAEAKRPTDRAGPMCFDACQMTLREPFFEDVRKGSSKLARNCLSRLGLTSLYLCLELNCRPESRQPGLAARNESCMQGLHTPILPYEIIANYTDDVIAGLRRITDEEVDSILVLNEVVLPSDEFYADAHDTLDAVAYVHKYHFLYGGAVTVFWIGVVAVGLLSRLVAAACMVRRRDWRPVPQREQFESDDPASEPRPITWTSRPNLWLRRYLTVPATFGYKCAQNVGWCTVPPRIQSLTIATFILLNTFFCIHGYTVFEGNLYFGTISKQIWRYLSDRTGIISFANFPIIWLFGMRNNLLMTLTGWDFGTYNNFHRWVARVATLQAVIHSIGYTYLILKDGGWQYFKYFLVQYYFWVGELATIFMCSILIFSVFWLRRNTYELFLVLHIVLSVLVLFTMLGHVSIFKGRFDFLVWVPAVIWVFDRIFRGLRVVAFNRKFWNTPATATYNPDSNIVRLSIPYHTSFYRPKPGTFYYLHVLNDLRFWESHPFTVASTTATRQVLGGHAADQDAALGDEAPLLLSGTSSSDRPAGKAPSTMTFLIRPYDSFTGRLRDTAAAAWPKPAHLRVLVDGPYGHTQPFHRFDHVLFVVGGSGIVVPLSHMASLDAPRSVRIVWAARERGFAVEVLREDFGDSLESAVATRAVDSSAGERLSLDVYITNKDEGSGDEGEEHPAPPQGVRMLSGRPDVAGEVEAAARAAQGGSLAVVACGPARMADDARRAVVDVLGKGFVGVEYFEESFTW